VDRRPGQVAVDGRQIRLPPENDVGGIFALVHAPVIGHPKLPVNRTEAACHLIQPMVKPLDLQPVGDLLGTLQSAISTKALSINWKSILRLRITLANQP